MRGPDSDHQRGFATLPAGRSFELPGVATPFCVSGERIISYRSSSPFNPVEHALQRDRIRPPAAPA